MRFKPLCIGVTKCCMVFFLHFVLLMFCARETLFDMYRMCQESHHFSVLEIPHSIGGFRVTIIIAVLPKDLKLLNSKV